MTRDPLDTSRLRRDFRAEVKGSTRATAVTGGLIAIVALPAWAGFDHLVDPEHAAEFTRLRLISEVGLVLLWLSLFTGRGRRHPELGMLLFFGIIQGVIAYMIVRVDGAYAPYALGMSLAIYAASYLLIWRWQYTAAMIGLTWAALAVALATAPEPLDGAALATIGFYLGTASLVAFVGQFHRQLTAWGEFCSRVELEAEQERSKELLKRLERLSREDSLTGLANRRAWDETFEREFERSRRQGTSLSVLLCDLDRLKEVNDRFGHATGDRVLEAAAQVLSSRVRAGDLAARVGGDEFAVLCPDTGLEGAFKLAEQLRLGLAELRAPHEGMAGVTLSIGVAAREQVDLSPTDLMQRADDRLYGAKRTRDAVAPERRLTVASSQPAG